MHAQDQESLRLRRFQRSARSAAGDWRMRQP
jgi:hypothetical protein